MTDPRVSCTECQRREAEIEARFAPGERQPSQMFNVGNYARPDMGHSLAFTTDGRIALCIARRKALSPS